jgi:hypothetical protein
MEIYLRSSHAGWYTACMHIPLVIIVLAIAAIVAPSATPDPVQQSGRAKEGTESSEPNVPPQRTYKRLILKDGSYERISKFEINGDRVRYFSFERHVWEEVPISLVDWSATERYAQEAAFEKQSRIKQSAEAEAKERAEEEAKTPLVAPGVRLPDTGGVFLLDTFQGKAELSQLLQNGANINKNTAGNILRGVINPIGSARQTIELVGLHARVQSHVPDPLIYVALDSGGDPSADYTPETAKDHFRIVRCEQKKGNRIVGVVSIAVYGKVSQDATYVETKVEPVSGSWVKVTPATPLPPGEYALVELLGKEGINTFVWDFGVNASAPENANTRKEEPARDDNPPVLQKRKKSAEP